MSKFIPKPSRQLDLIQNQPQNQDANQPMSTIKTLHKISVDPALSFPIERT